MVREEKEEEVTNEQAEQVWATVNEEAEVERERDGEKWEEEIFHRCFAAWNI